jgi:hypothetical protein
MRGEDIIQEPELKLLIREIQDLKLTFEEIQAPLPDSPEYQDIASNPDKCPGALPEGISVPDKIWGKTEQFFCVVERPDHWKRYLVTQKGLLRVMSAYGCTKLCKELGLISVTLKLNNFSN